MPALRQRAKTRASKSGFEGAAELNNDPLRVLSMGWGVQSWTLAAMMALDEIPRVDFLVHADTHHELQATYEFRRTWEPWLGEHGLTAVTVESDRTDVVREDWSNGVLIPAFTLDAKQQPGQVKRQCTHDWKILPIRRFVRSELERRGVAVSPGVVESHMGISFDEWKRQRTSDVAYITNVYPLVDRRITRSGCAQWLEAHDLPVPPKSGCTFCPYSRAARWQGLKREGGADWQEAVEVDAAIRRKRQEHGYTLFVHSARRPLEEAVTIPEDFGASQLEMEGCEGGHCWT